MIILLLVILLAKMSQYYFLSQAYKTSNPVIRARIFWTLMASFVTDVPLVWLVLYFYTHQ